MITALAARSTAWSRTAPRAAIGVLVALLLLVALALTAAALAPTQLDL